MKKSVVLYAETGNEWTSEELVHRSAKLPPAIRHKALQHHHWQDRQLTICGKLLLLKMLQQLNLDDIYHLQDMQYDGWKRPYLSTSFDFNIAHSGSIAACAGTLEGRVGIDIEQVKAEVPGVASDYFTPTECQAIDAAPDRAATFYELWTRKEAFLKAIGKGTHYEPSFVNALKPAMSYESKVYHLHSIEIEGYKGCVACNNEEDIVIERIII